MAATAPPHRPAKARTHCNDACVLLKKPLVYGASTTSAGSLMSAETRLGATQLHSGVGRPGEICASEIWADPRWSFLPTCVGGERELSER